jgi:hypothetical protein
MPAKKIIVALLIIVVAVGGFVAGLYLLRERQTLQEEAAVPGGQAEVSVSPSSGTFDVGQTINAAVSFNPANIAISGVAVRITYPFTSSTPEVSVQTIEINNDLTSTGDWTCPTQTNSQSGGNVVIDIACANTSANGFTANTDTLLANVKLQVNAQPASNPLVMRFDPALSVITRKSDNQDILLIPTSTGTYTVGTVVQSTATPVPTAAVTAAVTSAVTSAATKTPTPRLSITTAPTATGSASTGGTLPDAGVSTPTLLGIGLGIMVIVGSMLLAM